MKNGFLILDFGSQVTQLIARRYRDLGYYTEIQPHFYDLEKVKAFNPDGIILSGGPNSVYDAASPQRDIKELVEVAPVLGVCYGMQLICQQYGGKVEKGSVREYGKSEITWHQETNEFKTIGEKQIVWMSHGDVVNQVPEGFLVSARTSHHIAAIQGPRLMGFQFHPEVTHTEKGQELLESFAHFCGAKPNWKIQSIKDTIFKKVKDQVGDKHVLCALSGGVDSSVVGTLLTQALGADKVHCLFVDNGLLRKNEYEEVLKSYRDIGLNVIGTDASLEFLNGLRGISDPEQKRKIIGKLFIDIFDKNLPEGIKIDFLAQGTLYPDVIESVSVIGNSVTIKSHHNVGGLPEKMNLKLVEPVRELFKDEVRKLGKELGLPDTILQRHPFPGPGLAIRVMGEVTPEKLKILKEADAIFINYLKEKNLYHKIWQAFCVLLPVQTVGVMGDGRTYEFVLSLRAVTSTDGMTADWYEFDHSDLKAVSSLITNQVRGVNRIVYDITSKPPATIEWE